MKNSILIAVALLGTFSLANDIDSQLDAISKASTPQERVKLVNEFKVTLMNLNANDRADAINQLRSSMQGGTKTTPMSQMREQAQIHQMQDMQSGMSQQMMQQQNAISQAVSEGIINMSGGMINNPISGNGGGTNNPFPIQH
jgi:hypothetical protein